MFLKCFWNPRYVVTDISWGMADTPKLILHTVLVDFHGKESL